MRLLLSSIIFLASSLFVCSQQRVLLSDGWEFVKGDLASSWEAYRPVKQSKLPIWNKVSIPHCYNAYDAVDPDVPYYQGPGWYRSFLTINNPYHQGRTVLHFEGAGQKTQIYVYQQKIAEHVGGYDEFEVDITEAVEQYRQQFPDAETIPVAIRCDNSRDAQLIPSDLSDFNLYGGLYRNVHLVYLPETSLKNFKFNYDLNNDFTSAQINLSAQLDGSESGKELDCILKITDPDGQLVYSGEGDFQTESGQLEAVFSLELNAPVLWSPDTPNLYGVEVSLVDETQAVFTETFKTGFKHFEFIKKGPFHLNGERLLLRGTHRHEDHAGLGQSMPLPLLRKEMQMMKDMGVNFIRLGHYQQSRDVLNLCDELGLLVWEEIPWCRGGLGNETYKEQARRMLRNMIDQHYNHVSVILWGLGNENDWPGEFDYFEKDQIRAFMSELNDLSHEMDPVRKTCIRRCDFCKDVVDVYSPSIWAGWYRGKYTNYQQVSYDEAMEVDHFLHVEWGASHHAGRHSEDPDKNLAAIISKGADERDGDFLMDGGDPRVSKDGDWSETYACNLIDWHLKEQEHMDWLTGTAYWPFKDFSTPLRPENPVPYVNQKGVVQRDLRPKESFYVFQSYWTQKPMIHIYGHTWETRWGEPGESKLIKVYSNCSEVELFVNGKSVGTRSRNSQDFPAAGLRWKVTFKEGQNKVLAVGKMNGTVLRDEISFDYQSQSWGAEHELKLEVLERDGDTVTVCAKAYDEHGVFCPNSRLMVEFGVTGDAELLDNLGTWDGSRKIQLYNGRAMMKIKLTGDVAVASVKSAETNTALMNL